MSDNNRETDKDPFVGKEDPLMSSVITRSDGSENESIEYEDSLPFSERYGLPSPKGTPAPSPEVEVTSASVEASSDEEKYLAKIKYYGGSDDKEDENEENDDDVVKDDENNGDNEEAEDDGFGGGKQSGRSSILNTEDLDEPFPSPTAHEVNNCQICSNMFKFYSTSGP